MRALSYLGLVLIVTVEAVILSHVLSQLDGLRRQRTGRPQ